MYPDIMHSAKLPFGGVRVVSREGLDKAREKLPVTEAVNIGFDGLVHCRILPPQHLKHPLIEYRGAKKLLFPLCKVSF
jgi:hypothetical protein